MLKVVCLTTDAQHTHTHTLTLHLLPHSKWTMRSEHHRCQKELVWKDVLILFWGKRMHMKRHTHKHNTNWKLKTKKKSKSKKAKAQTEILPLRHKHQAQVNANQTCYQSLLTFRLIRFIFKDNRGRCHEMKGTDANRRDEQKGGQKDGMNSEQSWASFIFHALLWDESSFSAVVLASYLAMHEFKVDSFQCDLQQSTFASFHVLDRELSAQLRTWRRSHPN